jgi:histidinol phosphatase-like PHP family hydrolase
MITEDFHIHTEYSCDGACMTYDTLIKNAENNGIKKFGVTDHIHNPYNYGDIELSHAMYQEKKVPGMHFGVEVSCVSKWELDKIEKKQYAGDITYGVREGGPANQELAVAIDRDFIDKYEIEYVIGGTHWVMYLDHTRENLINDYHRQNLFLANHPLVDIVAHPWWYMGPHSNKNGMYKSLPWFYDFNVISKDIHKEFAQALIKNNKYHEINLGAMLLSEKYPEHFKKQYVEYLTYMKELGVKFSIGSDCHNREYQVDFNKASKILDEYGLKNDFTCG